MPSFTLECSGTLHVVAVCINRIGTEYRLIGQALMQKQLTTLFIGFFFAMATLPTPANAQTACFDRTRFVEELKLAPRCFEWNSPGFAEPAIPPLSAIHPVLIILPRSQGNSRPKPRLARCREAAALTSPGIGATPTARNEWPIITPSAEDKTVEFHLQRRRTLKLQHAEKPSIINSIYLHAV